MNEMAASVPVSPAAGEAKRRARRATTARRVAGAMGVVVLVTFVVAPLAGILSSSVTRSPFWEFPPNGFTLEWYKRFFDDQQMVRALIVSLQTGAFAAIVGTLVGLLAAAFLTGTRLGRSGFSRSVVLIPILVPNLALGVAIFILYIRLGIPITVLTLGLAQLILVLPLIIGLLVVAVETIPPNVQRASADLGASPLYSFIRVTFPLIRPAVVAAVVIAFIRGFDDSSVALFVNSPTTITLPVRMLIQLEHESGPIIATAGSILLLIAIVLAVVLERTIGLSKAFGIGKDDER